MPVHSKIDGHVAEITLDRLEALNATNTPHFSNPASNVSNLQLNPDGSVRSLHGFGVITSTDRRGRQYDEREFRLGVRVTF